jgi:cytoskeletal protein CcmA (bactofilin family)
MMKAQNLKQAGVQPPISGTAETSEFAQRTAAERTESTDRAPMSVIGADIVVTGNIEASVDLHIEGRVIGDVRCATLVLAESSYVHGRIFAVRAKVAGTVEGGLETKDLAVEASGRINGEIAYQRLRIANGGVIEGTVSHKPAE